MQFQPTDPLSFRVTLHHGTQVEWRGTLEMSVGELNSSGLLDGRAWFGPTHLNIFDIEFATTPPERVEFWPSARPSLVTEHTIRIDGRIHMDLDALNRSGILNAWMQPIPVRRVLVREF